MPRIPGAFMAGRADRSTWLRWTLAMAGVQMIAALALAAHYFAVSGTAETGFLAAIRYGACAALALSALACLAVSAARLRDIGRSGWHQAWLAAAFLGLSWLSDPFAMLAPVLFLAATAYLAFAPGAGEPGRSGPLAA